MSLGELDVDTLRFPLPWQGAAWQRLCQQRQNDRAPHALLLAGPPGVGKRRFAQALALSALCARPSAEGLACGQCKACALLRAGTHPDVSWLAPDDVGKPIRIDSVRSAVEFVAQTAQQGGRKIVVLAPAEALNRQAANALLKTLEEPPGAALLMLVSDAPGRLLPTLRSRCQRLEFPLPPWDATRKWLRPLAADEATLDEVLRETEGRPLAARGLLEDDALQRRRERVAALESWATGGISSLDLAQRWKDEDFEELLLWLSQRLLRATRCAMTGEPADDALTRSFSQAAPGSLLKMIEALQTLLGQHRSGTNPNRQLALEALLLTLQERLRPR